MTIRIKVFDLIYLDPKKKFDSVLHKRLIEKNLHLTAYKEVNQDG